MSRGHFDYIDQRAKNEIFGYFGDEQQRNVFEDREISELIWDVFELIHDFDYYKRSWETKKAGLTAKRGEKEKLLGIIFTVN